MKPHFHPGDQVIAADRSMGDVIRGYRGETSGRWWYWVRRPNGEPFLVREDDLWHVNSTVARQRALARKGILPPDPRQNEDDPHHPPVIEG